MTTHDFTPKEFDPQTWTTSQPVPSPASLAPVPARTSASHLTDSRAQVEALVSALQNGRVSLADDYDDWLHVGFALAHEFGEAGRSYFHQISSLSAKYDAAESDKKYTDCLRSQKTGVTLGTLFHLAKQKSVQWNNLGKIPFGQNGQNGSGCPLSPNNGKNGKSLIINNNKMENPQIEMEADFHFSAKSAAETSTLEFSQTFTDKLNPTKVPILIRDIMATMTDPASRDKMVLGALSVISGIVPNVYGLYGGHAVYPPLYFIFYGPAASRKGDIRACLNLLKPLSTEMRTAHERDMEQWKQQHTQWEQLGAKAEGRAQRGPEPEMPEDHSPRIPGNSSASAAYLALKANDGWGVIFETEADVISQALLSDYGDYSAGLRQAFHHEAITMNRVKDRLHIEIPCPRLAVAITCTPGQLPKLFPSFENGLGSRFLFYGLQQEMRWIDPFACDGRPLEETYEEMGERMLQLVHLLQQMGKRRIQFVLTQEQQQRFNDTFSQLLVEQFSMLGDGIASFVFRMGLSTFRIAMVLSLLRKFDGWVSPLLLFRPDEQTLLCCDDDFTTALTIMDTLVSHTSLIYSELAKDSLPTLSEEKQVCMAASEREMYAQLPTEFGRTVLRDYAEQHGMSERNAYRIVQNLMSKYHLVRRLGHGSFLKIQPGNTQNKPSNACSDGEKSVTL